MVVVPAKITVGSLRQCLGRYEFLQYIFINRIIFLIGKLMKIAENIFVEKSLVVHFSMKKYHFISLLTHS